MGLVYQSVVLFSEAKWRKSSELCRIDNHDTKPAELLHLHKQFILISHEVAFLYWSNSNWLTILAYKKHDKSCIIVYYLFVKFAMLMQGNMVCSNFSISALKESCNNMVFHIFGHNKHGLQIWYCHTLILQHSTGLIYIGSIWMKYNYLLFIFVLICLN